MSPDQLKTVYDLEIHQKMSMLDCQKLKTTVKRTMDQKFSITKFWTPEMIELKQGQWLRVAQVNVVLKEDKEFATNGKQMGSAREETSVFFRHDEDKRAKPTPKNRSIHQHKGVEVRRGKRTSEAGVHLANSLDKPCKEYLNGICTKSPVDNWHPPDCQFYRSESGCKFGDKVLICTQAG